MIAELALLFAQLDLGAHGLFDPGDVVCALDEVRLVLEAEPCVVAAPVSLQTIEPVVVVRIEVPPHRLPVAVRIPIRERILRWVVARRVRERAATTDGRRGPPGAYGRDRRHRRGTRRGGPRWDALVIGAGIRDHGRRRARDDEANRSDREQPDHEHRPDGQGSLRAGRPRG